MKNITKNISTLPNYLQEAISNQSISYSEQIRVKEYSKRIAPLEGQRTAIIPWSGGLDSTTSLIMAIEAGLNITTVFLDYGQPYIKKELQTVKKLQSLISRIYPEATWEMHILLDCHWVDTALKEQFSGEWGHIFPMRNFIILEEAATIAEEMPYSEIWFSCVQGEMPFSGGDKSIVFLTEMKERLAHRKINLTTPLIGLTKTDIVQWADADTKRLEVITNTISCFNGSESNHCGKCQACFNRAVGFFSAGKLDKSGINILTSDFSTFTTNYIQKLSREAYYSPTRRQQLQLFIDYLNNNHG